MNYWVTANTRPELDMGILEESALAMAQATIQNAINECGISRSELARRMVCNRSLVSRMLTGGHNLTIRTMARSMAACGFEVRFQPVPIEWNWVGDARSESIEDEVPAHAGTTIATTEMVALVVYA